jgi:GNAT superfamily N-acetyltransferase
MTNDYLERMIRLAEESFAAKDDPEQISVDEKTRLLLKRIHPATLVERTTEEGPIAWVLVIPTSTDVMYRFLDATINERQVLEQTLPGMRYEALYLCSALVLPEYRTHGIAKEAALESLKAIRRKHPIQALYYWAFSREGELLAESVAREAHLPLFKRNK